MNMRTPDNKRCKRGKVQWKNSTDVQNIDDEICRDVKEQFKRTWEKKYELSQEIFKAQYSRSQKLEEVKGSNKVLQTSQEFFSRAVSFKSLMN